MKKITGFLMGLAMMFSLSSCVTTVHAQDDTYFNGEVDASIIVTYGTPFIINGMIEYYVYRGWYYYPYWVNNSYYFHRYRRPLPPEHFHNWYRPIPRSYHYPKPLRHMNTPQHVHRRPSHNNIGTHGGRPHGNPGGGHAGRDSFGRHR